MDQTSSPLPLVVIDEGNPLCGPLSRPPYHTDNRGIVIDKYCVTCYVIRRLARIQNQSLILTFINDVYIQTYSVGNYIKANPNFYGCIMCFS